MSLLRVSLWMSMITVAVPTLAQQVPDEGADEAPPDALETARDARRHFEMGVEHFEAHRYRDAVRAWELAAQLVPSADLWFNIARAHEELFEYEAAIEHYQRYLRDRVDPPDRLEVERHIEALRQRAASQRERQRVQPTTGALRLSTSRDGAEVEFDGEPAAVSPWEQPREVQPGRHRLAVLREGYVPFRSEISVEAGMTTAAYADLVPETRYRAIRSDRIFTWLAWGLSAASLGAAIGLGVEAASRQDVDLGSSRSWAAYSDAALGAALGLLVVGLVLWFIEGRAVGTERITIEDEDARRVRGL